MRVRVVIRSQVRSPVVPATFFHNLLEIDHEIFSAVAGLGGSFGYAVQLKTRESRVQLPPRSATFFREDWS